jgi:hypothetical protein
MRRQRPVTIGRLLSQRRFAECWALTRRGLVGTLLVSATTGPRASLRGVFWLRFAPQKKRRFGRSRLSLRCAALAKDSLRLLRSALAVLPRIALGFNAPLRFALSCARFARFYSYAAKSATSGDPPFRCCFALGWQLLRTELCSDYLNCCPAQFWRRPRRPALHHCALDAGCAAAADCRQNGGDSSDRQRRINFSLSRSKSSSALLPQRKKTLARLTEKSPQGG